MNLNTLLIEEMNSYQRYVIENALEMHEKKRAVRRIKAHICLELNPLDPKANYKMAIELAWPNDEEKDFEKAREHLVIAAENGHVAACKELWAYYIGAPSMCHDRPRDMTEIRRNIDFDKAERFAELAVSNFQNPEFDWLNHCDFPDLVHITRMRRKSENISLQQ